MKILLGNQKSYMKENEVLKLLDNYGKFLKSDNIIIFPSSLYLHYYRDRGIKVGLQDISLKNTGNNTGLLTIDQALSSKVQYVIIGHSEVRERGESEYDINQKLKMLIKSSITPILCIGETKEEKLNKETLYKLKYQLKRDLENIDSASLIIAYEPIWAIGTGLIPKSEDIDLTIKLIKKEVKELTGNDIPVLYGGSVSASNIKELKDSKCDGYLVGKASTSYEFPLINSYLRINDYYK